jgi:hypothetical protein
MRLSCLVFIGINQKIDVHTQSFIINLYQLQIYILIFTQVNEVKFEICYMDI